MIARLRRRLARSDLWSYNLRNRDRWVAEQARLVRSGARVIDVGAGSAPYRCHFSHCSYKTQDFGGLEDAQLRHGGYDQIDFVCDARSIPSADGAFDVVLCTEVLEHHPEPIAVVREFARILAPGGRLLVTAPLGSGIHQEPHHYYGGYTPFWYRKFLAEAGFHSVTIAANEGSLRHFAQEAVRFVRMTRPGALSMPLTATILWIPVWALLLPFLAVVVPIGAYLLDRFDREQRFTVGYHVTAVRAGKSSAA
ncbi:MAG: class I SAM-dependent methyltransferase [Hyphomonadaceae bacterium]|nr:class I SAM-dependent methyltransferase [Hyphomonadaceae bacterium]